MRILAVAVALLVLLPHTASQPTGRQVAITIDDVPCYLPDHYAGRNGFSWIHRWSRTRGLAPKGEPDPPAWVQDNWAVRR